MKKQLQTEIETDVWLNSGNTSIHSKIKTMATIPFQVDWKDNESVLNWYDWVLTKTPKTLKHTQLTTRNNVFEFTVFPEGRMGGFLGNQFRIVVRYPIQEKDSQAKIDKAFKKRWWIEFSVRGFPTDSDNRGDGYWILPKLYWPKPFEEPWERGTFRNVIAQRNVLGRLTWPQKKEEE